MSKLTFLGDLQPGRVMKYPRRIFSLVAVMVTAIGCGSGADLQTGGTCGKVQPCGGSVIGNWKVSSTCILDDSFLSVDTTGLCAGTTLALKKVSGSGGITFRADQTYQSTGTIAIDFTMGIPTTCFAPGNTCAGLSADLRDPTITAVSCTTVGSACECQITTKQDTTEAGTYSTSGTTLTTTHSAETPSADPYCVEGNQLHELAVDMSMQMGAMGMVKIAADLVLTKE